MANPGFNQYYKARYIDLMNTTLNCSFTLPLNDSMIAVIQPEMQAQCTKWGETYSTWQANAASFRADISTRCNAMTQGLIDCYAFGAKVLINLHNQTSPKSNLKQPRSINFSFVSTPKLSLASSHNCSNP